MISTKPKNIKFFSLLKEIGTTMFADDNENGIHQDQDDFELSDAEIHKFFVKLQKEIQSAKKLILIEEKDDEQEFLSIKLIYDDSFGFKI